MYLATKTGILSAAHPILLKPRAPRQAYPHPTTPITPIRIIKTIRIIIVINCGDLQLAPPHSILPNHELISPVASFLINKDPQI